MAQIIDNDFNPVDQGLDATDDHWGTQRASTADAAAGLAQAREDRKLSNNAIGNNQIKTRSYGSAMGLAQRASNRASTYN